jgi:hypothetical protein
MTSTVVLKAAGLSLSPNQLNLEDGALKTASNVIIKRDGVIESRRGYGIYGEGTDNQLHLIKQLHTYRQRLLRHYNNVLEWDDGAGNFTPFSKSVMETQTGLRMKSIESNGNFYLTTSEGIKKISINSAADYSTATIVNAGGVKATDFTTTVKYILGNQSGFLPSNSTVAYRTLWATKDANKNLILGNPSQRQVVYNPLMNTLVQDYMQVLARLDQVTDSTNLTRIGDGNYIDTLKIIANATASEFRNAALALATKIDTDIQYAEVGTNCAIDITGKTYTTVGATAPRTCTLNIDNLNTFLIAGQWIELKGFTDTTMNEKVQIVTVNGTQITFSTSGAAAVGTAVNAGAKIYSADFQKITQPVIPSVSPTDDELKELQTYLSNIIIKLQDLPVTNTLTGIVVTSANKLIIDELDISLTNNVTLNVTIPQDVVNAGLDVYFLQIYRSPTISASGVSVLSDLAPSDELQLVYEVFPTSVDLAAGTVEFLDETPDQFLGANLYTNPTTGEGILQANDLPPFAKDINRFKNYVFYANTKTRQRLTISLIGVTKIIDHLTTGYARFSGTINTESGGTGTLTVTSTSTGIVGNKIITGNGTDICSTLIGAGYTIVTGGSLILKSGNTVDINNSSIMIGSQVYKFVLGSQEVSTITTVADVANSLNGKYFDIYSANNETAYRFYFKTSTGTDTPPSSTGKFLVRIGITTGSNATVVGEKIRDALNVNLIDFAATATTGTVTITNVNEGFCTDLSAGTSGFTVNVTNQGVGEDITSKKVLVSSVVSPAQAVDLTARSLVRIINKNSSDVTYAYYLSSSTDVPGKILLETRDLSTAAFNVICNNSDAGTSFNPDLTTASPSENETKPNRIYYSKIYQPESVPITNYFDVGAEEQEILRIFPLRDSLFVFKQDALYRISGETAPFSVALFDSSCDLVAPDSVSVANNYLYGWTTQGIAVVSESLTQIVSRPVDVVILPLSTPNYPNFTTATWGVGYESDNSYTAYTVSKTTDTVATIGFRYSNLTNSWTTIDKSTTCGILNGFDDKLYLGAGDVNFVEQERKSFTRLDYCDREYVDSITSGRYNGLKIRLNTLTNISVGDVVLQSQGVSLTQFNSLLRKLDVDAQTVYKNFYTDFVSTNGCNLKTSIQGLAAKLDATISPTPAPTYVSVLSTGSTLTDIKNDYNAIIAKLNLDAGIAGSNFLAAIPTSFEAVITEIKASTKEVTISYAAPFYIGAISFFESIDCSFTYAPITMGDPVNWKHLREASIMLESRAISRAELAFSTDLLPEFLAVDFLLDGNGIFGSGNFGETFFGGGSNSAPLRTIIPRQAQRCRYVLVRFKHKVAREKFSVFGATITGEIIQSSRAYR